MYFKINKPVKGRTSLLMKIFLTCFVLYIGGLALQNSNPNPSGMLLLLILEILWISFVVIVPLWQKFSFRPVLALDFQPTSVTIIFKNQPPLVLYYETTSGNLVFCLNSAARKGGYDVYISQIKMCFCNKENGEKWEVQHQPACPVLFFDSLQGREEVGPLLPYWESLADKKYTVELTHPNRVEEKKAEPELLSMLENSLIQRGKYRGPSVAGVVCLLSVFGIILAFLVIWKIRILQIFVIGGIFYIGMSAFIIYKLCQQGRLIRNIEADFIRQDAIMRERQPK